MDNLNITIEWGMREIPVVMARGATNGFCTLASTRKQICSRVYTGEIECLPISLMYYEDKPVCESWLAIMTYSEQEHYMWGHSAQHAIDGLRVLLENAAEEISGLLNPKE